MEHIFILNPAAGKNTRALSLIPQIQKVCKKHDVKYQIHISESGHDIVDFVKKTCADSDEYRFYALGGDGTLSHVVNGSMASTNVSVGVMPLGTGNDFIKTFDIPAKFFLDVERQITGQTVAVDLLKYNDKYCINLCNIGFDANVAVDMPAFKKLPFVTNHAAYNLSIGYNVLKKLGRPLQVFADGKLLFSGKGLMCAVANGSTCGGGFKVAPKAIQDDGLIDVCVVTPPSRLQLATFVKNIGAGTQLENPDMQPYIYYSQCKTVTVKSPKAIPLVNDGEGELFDSVTFEILPRAVNFILPSFDKNEK